MAEKKKKKSADAGSTSSQMERLLAKATRTKSRTAKSAAQDLVYEAWEEEDLERAMELFQRAADLDPTNVDAWLGMLEFAMVSADERIDLLRALVAMGEKNLGADFNEFKGHFWGFLETRPYMRARDMLARELAEGGRTAEAIGEHEAMLELNPGDNQGVRYELVAAYLAEDRREDARKLIARYDECTVTTVWAWAHVLERFLAGALGEAQQALAVARLQNPHAEEYFLGRKKMPKTLPNRYGLGSREEALIARDTLRMALARHPKFVAWLRSELKPSASEPHPGDFRIVP